MKPRRTPSSNFVYRLVGGTEDNDLWCRVGVDEEGHSIVGSVWVPTSAEREAIAAGSNIALLVWGNGHPPVQLQVTPEQPGRS